VTTKNRVLFTLAILGATACATGGSGSDRAGVPATPSTPRDPVPCGGNDIDLAAVLANKRCRPSRDAPATPASAAGDLKITLHASTSSVSPGGHVDLTLEIFNAGATPIPLYFSGDLTLGVEVIDDKGARLSPPAGNAPKNADPRCAQVDCRLPESHVVLTPGARAHATLGWDATKTAWPTSGPTTCCTYHVDPVPGGPLSDGTYAVKIPLPYESNKDNPADPEISIHVGR
jgi:hypothetical protein